MAKPADHYDNLHQVYENINIKLETVNIKYTQRNVSNNPHVYTHINKTTFWTIYTCSTFQKMASGVYTQMVHLGKGTVHFSLFLVNQGLTLPE